MAETRPSRAIPVALLVAVVAAASLFGALIGLQRESEFQSETVFSTGRLGGGDVPRAELRRLADELVVVARLPLVDSRVREANDLKPNADLQATVSGDEEAEGVVRFTAVGPTPEASADVARSLARESVRFLVQGRQNNAASGALSDATAAAELALVDTDLLITPVKTGPKSAWPSALQSAVVAGFVTLLVGAGLFSARSHLSSPVDPHPITQAEGAYT